MFKISLLVLTSVGINTFALEMPSEPLFGRKFFNLVGSALLRTENAVKIGSERKVSVYMIVDVLVLCTRFAIIQNQPGIVFDIYPRNNQISKRTKTVFQSGGTLRVNKSSACPIHRCMIDRNNVGSIFTQQFGSVNLASCILDSSKYCSTPTFVSNFWMLINSNPNKSVLGPLCSVICSMMVGRVNASAVNSKKEKERIGRKTFEGRCARKEISLLTWNFKRKFGRKIER